MGSAVIRGTGSYLPEKILTNRDLEIMVDTTDEWIVTRTGIRERRICPSGQASSDLGAQAARRACEDAGVDLKDIGMIICATITADMPFPSTACIIQSKLGLANIPAFDMTAACSGFIYALETAKNFVISRACDNVLVIAAECMSRFTDYTDRSTCVLLGDGAGAAVVAYSDEDDTGIRGSFLSAAGKYGNLLHVPAGGSLRPASFDTVEQRLHFMKMEGSSLFKTAVLTMSEAAEKIMRKFELSADDVCLVIPHQANMRIIAGVARALGLPLEKFYINIEKYGNMSAACVPIALDEVRKKGLARKNDLVVTVAFGAGLTWASNLIKLS